MLERCQTCEYYDPALRECENPNSPTWQIEIAENETCSLWEASEYPWDIHEDHRP